MKYSTRIDIWYRYIYIAYKKKIKKQEKINYTERKI